MSAESHGSGSSMFTKLALGGASALLVGGAAYAGMRYGYNAYENRNIPLVEGHVNRSNVNILPTSPSVVDTYSDIQQQFNGVRPTDVFINPILADVWVPLQTKVSTARPNTVGPKDRVILRVMTTETVVVGNGDDWEAAVFLRDENGKYVQRTVTGIRVAKASDMEGANNVKPANKNNVMYEVIFDGSEDEGDYANDNGAQIFLQRHMATIGNGGRQVKANGHVFNVKRVDPTQ